MFGCLTEQTKKRALLYTDQLTNGSIESLKEHVGPQGWLFGMVLDNQELTLHGSFLAGRVIITVLFQATIEFQRHLQAAHATGSTSLSDVMAIENQRRAP